jgi:hypothetical protein
MSMAQVKDRKSRMAIGHQLTDTCNASFDSKTRGIVKASSLDTLIYVPMN